VLLSIPTLNKELKMNAYEIAIGAGVGVIIMWFVAYVLCRIGQWVWAWIDDSKADKANPLVKFLSVKVFGYHYFGGDQLYTYSKSSDYYAGERSDGEFPFFTSLAATSLLPLVVVLSLDFYPVAIGLATSVLLAMLARFSRRVKKQFDAHKVDKEAHK
jgi:hypothetical protein